MNEGTTNKRRATGRPFQKGVSGNPKGKPVGTKNKVNGRVREVFAAILEDNIGNIREDLKMLEPKDRIKALLDLSQYVLPKLQATTIDANVNGEVQEKRDIYLRIAEQYEFSAGHKILHNGQGQEAENRNVCDTLLGRGFGHDTNNPDKLFFDESRKGKGVPPAGTVEE